MKKRLIALLLVLSTFLELLSGCSGANNDDNPDPSGPDSPGASTGDGYVTRGEWISMLGQAFGLDTYAQESPYYADVASGSDIYPYVQSAREWGMLGTFGDTFAPDQLVTLREVAVCAAVVAGMALPDEGDVDPDEAVNYATANQIIGSGAMTDNLTQSECEAVVSAAQDAFLREPVEQKAEATFTDNTVDLSQAEVEVSGARATLPGTVRDDGGRRVALVETANGVVEVGEGDVFVTAPTREHPAGVGYKVVTIEEANGELTVITEAPTLSDLYDKLSVNMTVAATAENIIWESGVSARTLSSDSNSPGGYQITLSANGGEPARALHASPNSYTYSHNHHFEFGKGATKNWSNKNSSKVATGEGSQALEDSNFVYDKTPSIEDFNGSTDSWTKNLKVENKFSAGYKITGDININALTVTTTLEFDKVKIFGFETNLNDITHLKEASVKLNSDITASLKLEGNLSEQLKIATIPIPIAATGLSVSIDLFLYADASGSLQVSAELHNEAKAGYMNGNLEHSAKSTASAEANVAIQVDFGAQLTASLDAVGVIKIMDASVKAGGQLEASASVGGSCEVSEENGKVKTVYSESMNLQADLYAPIVSFSVGGSGTLISKVGLTKTWNIITKDKAKHWELLHYEWTFWEETVITDEEGEVEETEVKDNSDEAGATDEQRLDLVTYVLTLFDESKRLELDLHGAAAAPAVTWSSSDPSVAQVDQNGVVTAVSTGVATITVALQSDPGVVVRCVVYVQKAVDNDWVFLPNDIRFSV